MARRQREWAKRARLQLIESLGGKCVDCGSVEELQLDHIEPCTWAERRPFMEQSQRLSVMRREAKEGKITVRCKRCNVSKGNHSFGFQPRMPELEPVGETIYGEAPF